jgi:transposase
MARIREIEGRLASWHRQSRVSRLLATVPGIGIMGASAIAATVADPSLFRSGREFAAWLGMTPRQNSSGGKEGLGRTSKRGDKYIRSLLTAGAVAVLRHARNRPTRDGEWVRALLARKPTKLAAVALAKQELTSTQVVEFSVDPQFRLRWSLRWSSGQAAKVELTRLQPEAREDR